MIGAVKTSVDAVIRQIERREDDYAVAVEGELDLLGDLIDALSHLGIVAGEQHRRLTVSKAVAAAACGRWYGTSLL